MKAKEAPPKIEKINRFFTSASLSNEWLYAPNLFGGSFWNARATTITNAFNALGIRLSGTLNESNDYFEPRGDIIGREKFIRPVWTSTRAWFSSNYQKRIALDLGIGYDFGKTRIEGSWMRGQSSGGVNAGIAFTDNATLDSLTLSGYYDFRETKKWSPFVGISFASTRVEISNVDDTGISYGLAVLSLIHI